MNAPLLASALLFLAVNAPAALVFQADFNGSGTGTGGANDIVTLGGTGQLYSHAQSNVEVSISSANPLAGGLGGYLSLNDMGKEQSGGRAAGVILKPTGVGSSLDSWYTDGGTETFDTLNGGFDFFFRTNNEAVTPNSFRFLDENGGEGGLRLILNSHTDGSFQLNLNGVIGATSSVIPWQADTTYHMAVTFSTNGTGHVTASLFLATGNTAIDTSSATHRILMATSANPLDTPEINAISKAFGSADADGFLFGHKNNSVDDVKVFDIDVLRIHDSVPATFAAVPEPGSVTALALGALACAGARYLRRRGSGPVSSRRP